MCANAVDLQTHKSVIYSSDIYGLRLCQSSSLTRISLPTSTVPSLQHCQKNLARLSFQTAENIRSKSDSVPSTTCSLWCVMSSGSARMCHLSYNMGVRVSQVKPSDFQITRCVNDFQALHIPVPDCL